MGYRVMGGETVSREKKLMLALLAVLITILLWGFLWTSIWALIKFMLFIAVVYIVYRILKSHV